MKISFSFFLNFNVFEERLQDKLQMLKIGLSDYGESEKRIFLIIGTFSLFMCFNYIFSKNNFIFW